MQTFWLNDAVAAALPVSAQQPLHVLETAIRQTSGYARPGRPMALFGLISS